MKASFVNRGQASTMFAFSETAEDILPPSIFPCDTVRESLGIVLGFWRGLWTVMSDREPHSFRSQFDAIYVVYTHIHRSRAPIRCLRISMKALGADFCLMKFYVMRVPGRGHRASSYGVAIFNAHTQVFGRKRASPTCESNCFHLCVYTSRYQRLLCTLSAADNKRIEELHRELKRRLKEYTSNNFSNGRESVRTLFQEFLHGEHENLKYDLKHARRLRTRIFEEKASGCSNSTPPSPLFVTQRICYTRPLLRLLSPLSPHPLSVPLSSSLVQRCSAFLVRCFRTLLACERTSRYTAGVRPCEVVPTFTSRKFGPTRRRRRMVRRRRRREHVP